MTRKKTKTKQKSPFELSKVCFPLFFSKEKEKVTVGPVSYLSSRVIPHIEEDAGGQKAAPFHLQRSVAQALPAVGMERTELP